MIAKVFPTINNIPPYESKLSTPYFEIYTTDTTVTGKGDGFVAKWYTTSTLYNGEPSSAINIWQSVVPMIKFYSGKYPPPELSKEFDKSEQFEIAYITKFKSNHTNASFWFYGNGNITVLTDITERISNKKLGYTNETAATFSENAFDPVKFYNMAIKYWNNGKRADEDNFFIGMWKNPDMDEPIVMAAGQHFLSSGNTYIPATKLSYIIDTNLNIDKNRISRFSFSIPIVSTSASIGYKYIENGDYFQDVSNSNKKIQKFKMIEYFAGYKYEDNSISTITKFVGQVRDWNFSRDKSGKAFAKINCYDWNIFLHDTLNYGYPNITDYIAAGYMDDSQDGVAGGIKPRTYDSWNFTKVIDNLLLNAYIDPYLMRQKRKHLNVDNNIVEGNYLNENKNHNIPIRLDSEFAYGNPSDSISSDDKYNWQFSIGETIADNIQKIMNNYGFQYGFNNEGKFYVSSVKNPITIKSPDSVTSDWTELINYNSIFSFVHKSTTIGNTITATFIGENAKLIVGVGNSYGTIHIKLSNPTLGMVATTDYSLDHSRSWHFFDGIDDKAGYNPCIINLGNTYGYGSYSLNITHSAGGQVEFNALMVQDIDNEVPDLTIYSGDVSNTKGVILDSIGLTSSSKNLRNDILVIGKLKNIKTSLALSDEGLEVYNKFNPVADHIISRAIDLVSLGSISNVNYVGKPLQMAIIEPSISTERRARWLAIETLKRYNEHKKGITPKITIIGNPLIEIGDLLAIKDINLGVLATSNNYWVSNISEIRNEQGYKTTLALETQAPWESYYNYPTPSLGRFNYKVFQNVSFRNTGLPIKTNTEETIFLSDNGTDVWIGYMNSNGYNAANRSDNESILKRIPPKGYMKVGDEVIKYENRGDLLNDAFSNDFGAVIIIFSNLTRGMFNTTQSDWNVNYYGKRVNLCISPYSQEDFGYTPNIQFTLLVPGFVRVRIQDENSNDVAVLTGSDSTDAYKQWDYLEAGKEHFYSWNMIDNFGKHNEANTGRWYKAGDSNDTPNNEHKIADTDLKGKWEDFYGTDRGESLGIEGKITVSSGYYVTNIAKRNFGRFRFIVDYIDKTRKYFNTSQSLSEDIFIWTAIRNTGRGISWYTAGIGEQANIGQINDNPIQYASSIDYTGTATTWLDENGISITGGRSDEYRRFYTGLENGGLGLKFNIKNWKTTERQIELIINRYIFSFLYSHVNRNYFVDEQGWNYREHEDVDSFPVILDSLGKQRIIVSSNYEIPIYIKPSTQTPFVDSVMLSKKNNLETEVIFNKPTQIIKMATCQLHLIELVAIDNSRRTTRFTKSIFYVDPQFNTDGYEYITGYPVHKIKFKETVGENSAATGRYISLRSLGGNTISFVTGYNIPKIGFSPICVVDNNNQIAIRTDWLFGVRFR